MSVPPVPPLPLVLLFLCIQLPLISLSMLFTPSFSERHVMRQTPRKNKLIRYEWRLMEIVIILTPFFAVVPKMSLGSVGILPLV